MGAAVAPAAATAFGAPAASAAVYSSLAASAALPTVASMAAGPIASAGSSMMMSQALLSPASALRLAGGGGLLSSIGTAMDVINKYSGLLSAGSMGIQAINAYQRGQYLEESYKIQAEQMRQEQEIRRLNLLKAANDKTRDLLAINSNAVATGFARGVNSFDGSVKLITKVNQDAYLRDISTLEFNQVSSGLFEDAQASMLAAAGDEAVRGSKFDAIYHIGGALNMYNKTRVPS